jgi:K+-sensing histidine kinase KdpD
MLSEGHRRVERGTDVVVAFVEHHNRPRTEVMLHGLEHLAVARGFLEAMDGTLTAEDTPGGLTMVITLPLKTGAPQTFPGLPAEATT